MNANDRFFSLSAQLSTPDVPTPAKGRFVNGSPDTMALKKKALMVCAADLDRGRLLDLAVRQGLRKVHYNHYLLKKTTHAEFLPSFSWRVGGPIIDEHRISIDYTNDHDGKGGTLCYATVTLQDGTTTTYCSSSALVAAMRCFVHLVFGGGDFELLDIKTKNGSPLDEATEGEKCPAATSP